MKYRPAREAKVARRVRIRHVATLLVALMMVPFLPFAQSGEAAASMHSTNQQGNAATGLARQLRNFVEPPCVSFEQDGAIQLANQGLVSFNEDSPCTGEIGDGKFGLSSGDVDFFELPDVAANTQVGLNAATQDGQLAITLGFYSADGTLLAQSAQDDLVFLSFSVSEPGDYFVAVSGGQQLLANPFDPTSGPGAATRGTYELVLFEVQAAPGFELPDNGTFSLVNALSGDFLGADAAGEVNTGNFPAALPEHRWELTNLRPNLDIYNLRSNVFGGYLDGDRNGNVDQSNRPFNDDRWQIILTNDGNFLLFSPTYGRYLTQNGNDVELTDDTSDAARWFIRSLSTTASLVGRSISLQSLLTERYLDIDENGDVNQSRIKRDDDIWNVLDAEDGYVFLQNAVTGRYLDGDKTNGNVDSSKRPRSDDRWLIVALDASCNYYSDAIIDGCLRISAIVNVDTGGFLAARQSDQKFNVETERPPTNATDWHIQIQPN